MTATLGLVNTALLVINLLGLALVLHTLRQARLRSDRQWRWARTRNYWMERMMASVKDLLVGIQTQLGKARSEIVGKIAELEAKVADGTITEADLAPLREAAQALDDIVLDVPPVDEPVEVPEPADPEPEPAEPVDPPLVGGDPVVPVDDSVGNDEDPSTPPA